MTHEDILLLARQAGFSPDAAKSNKLAKFAALTYAAGAAAEREACALIMDRNAEVCNTSSMLSDVLHGAAAAIRARGLA